MHLERLESLEKYLGENTLMNVSCQSRRKNSSGPPSNLCLGDFESLGYVDEKARPFLRLSGGPMGLLPRRLYGVFRHSEILLIVRIFRIF